MNRTPGITDKPRCLSESATIIVMLDRPTEKNLQNCTGQEKSEILRAKANHWRRRIVAWIEDQGLRNHLVQLDVLPTGNLLRVKGTHALAKSLRHSPGIVCVGLADDFELIILDEV